MFCGLAPSSSHFVCLIYLPLELLFGFCRSNRPIHGLITLELLLGCFFKRRTCLTQWFWKWASGSNLLSLPLGFHSATHFTRFWFLLTWKTNGSLTANETMWLHSFVGTKRTHLFFMFGLFWQLRRRLIILELRWVLLWRCKNGQLSSLPLLRHWLWLLLQEVNSAPASLYQMLVKQSTYMTWMELQSTCPTTLLWPQ